MFNKIILTALLRTYTEGKDGRQQLEAYFIIWDRDEGGLQAVVIGWWKSIKFYVYFEGKIDSICWCSGPRAWQEGVKNQPKVIGMKEREEWTHQ